MSESEGSGGAALLWLEILRFAQDDRRVDDGHLFLPCTLIRNTFSPLATAAGIAGSRRRTGQNVRSSRSRATTFSAIPAQRCPPKGKTSVKRGASTFCSSARKRRRARCSRVFTVSGRRDRSEAVVWV